jgi:3-methyladenine DNA glycosylase Mpg
VSLTISIPPRHFHYSYYHFITFIGNPCEKLANITKVIFVAGKTGKAQAVLIRAAEPLDEWQADLSGPGKLTRALKITRSYDSMDLCGDKLYLLSSSRIRLRIKRSKRIGIEYAKEWKDTLLRFYDADSPAVSGDVSCRTRPSNAMLIVKGKEQ